MRLDEIVRVSFIDTNEQVIEALANEPGEHFRNCSIICGDILRHPLDEPCTLVSPANTIGNMDGGLDLQYSSHFPRLEETLRKYIKCEHGGVLRIGTAQVIPLRRRDFTYVIFAPTVEKPGNLATPASVYLAMVAALTSVVMHNYRIQKDGIDREPIDCLRIPGLGTGFGGLEPGTAATQMREAYGMINLYHEHIPSIVRRLNSGTESYDAGRIAQELQDLNTKS